jgi:hypothetical protein
LIAGFGMNQNRGKHTQYVALMELALQYLITGLGMNQNRGKHTQYMALLGARITVFDNRAGY